MRTKEEILKASHKAISKAPKEGQEMLVHKYLLLEAIIDIRDILSLQLEMIHTSLFEFLQKK